LQLPFNRVGVIELSGSTVVRHDGGRWVVEISKGMCSNSRSAREKAKRVSAVKHVKLADFLREVTSPGGAPNRKRRPPALLFGLLRPCSQFPFIFILITRTLFTVYRALLLGANASCEQSYSEKKEEESFRKIEDRAWLRFESGVSTSDRVVVQLAKRGLKKSNEIEFGREQRAGSTLLTST
jgi:hypothetical protein